MDKVVDKPCLRGELSEFLATRGEDQSYMFQSHHARQIGLALQGKLELHEMRFRIPAADIAGVDIYFNNSELLVRFASLPTKTQREFLQTARYLMAGNGVLEIYLVIQWSQRKQRVLEIKAPGTTADKVLDFILL